MATVFDHSMAWDARLAAADLLAALLLQGAQQQEGQGGQAAGQVREAALQMGAFQALVEVLDREMFPFYRWALQLQAVVLILDMLVTV